MTEVKQIQKRALHGSRLHLAEHMRNIWYVIPEAGTTVEEMLDASYWAHISRSLKPNDRIEADAEDGTFFAEFKVQDAAMNFAKVVLLRKVDLEPAEVAGDSMALAGHRAQWSGPHTKWRAIRDSDRKVLKDGFATKSDCNAWLAGHARALVA